MRPLSTNVTVMAKEHRFGDSCDVRKGGGQAFRRALTAFAIPLSPPSSPDQALRSTLRRVVLFMTAGAELPAGTLGAYAPGLR